MNVTVKDTAADQEWQMVEQLTLKTINKVLWKH